MEAGYGQITIFDLPDQPGNCSRVFQAVAAGGINVDMIVQNLGNNGRAELSFSVPRDDFTRALKRTQDAVLPIDARSARLEYVRYKPHVLCRAAYRLDGEFFMDVRACRPEDFTAAGEIVLNDREDLANNVVDACVDLLAAWHRRAP